MVITHVETVIMEVKNSDIQRGKSLQSLTKAMASLVTLPVQSEF